MNYIINTPREIILFGIQEKCLIQEKQSRHKRQSELEYIIRFIGCTAILKYAYIYTNDHMLLYHKGTVTLKPKPGTDYHIKR